MPTSEIVTNANDGHITAVRTALKGASRIIIVSGYATLPGFNVIRPDVKQCLSKGGKATLVLGVDRTGITSADLIDSLGKLLRRYKKQLSIYLVFEQPGREFLHAKVYWGEQGSPTSAHLVVGSANLTKPAFQTNYEMSLADTGNLRRHQQQLVRFVNNLRDRRRLTAKRARKLAKEMRAASPTRVPRKMVGDENTSKSGRDRTKALKNVLASTTELMCETEENWIAWATDFVNEGTFMVSDADLDNMTITTGLNYFYEKGILPAVSQRTAGTAQIRQPAPSARIPVLPRYLSQKVKTIQQKVGRRLTNHGFKTPFGVWVPTLLTTDVHQEVQSDFEHMPSTSELEQAVDKELTNHRNDLTATVHAIVEQVAKDQICHPTEWRIVPRELRHIQRRHERPESEWSPQSSDYEEALQYIQSTLSDKLDRSLKPDVFVSRVRRLRPGIVHIPVDLSSCPYSLATFLSEVAWQVAEHLLSEKPPTRKAVVQMCTQLDSGFRKQPEALAELSAKLLEPSEQEHNAINFFRAFGRPPYW